MKVSIHQPQCWPWPRYIHKIASCDIFVYLDTVQFSKNGFQNRNRIKTPTGASWLTVPVLQRLGQEIHEVKISDSAALQRQSRTLALNYARTVGFQRWAGDLQQLLESPTDSLCEFAISSTEWMLEKLGVETRRIVASEIVRSKSHGSQLIASICEALHATSYLTGNGALAYMEPLDFQKVGCDILIQQWTAFEYDQVFPEVGFVSDLSTIDLLLNCPDTAAQLINSHASWLRLGDSM